MRKSLFILFVMYAGASHALPTADAILKASRDRDDGSSYATNVVLRLIASNGKTRERNLYMLQKDLEDKEERALMYFHSPADVRGVSFLIASYNDVQGKSNDQWMYLPAFRKARRIGSNDKRGSFMGSTFSYSDLDKIRISDYQSTLVGEEVISGRDAWLIDRVPVSQAVINKTGYHKTRVWIDKERQIVLKQDYYNIKDIVFKSQQTLEVEQIQGIWTIMKSRLDNFENNKSSEMVFTDITYNYDISERQVSQRALRKGINPTDMPTYQ